MDKGFLGVSRNRVMLAVIAVAIALRLAALLFLPDSLLRDGSSDPDSYGQFASTLARSGTYGPATSQPSAYRPPLYPLALVPFYLREPPARAGIAVLHLVLAGITVWGAFHLANELHLTMLAGLIAGLAVAVDPILIRQSSVLMTETLFVALLVWLLVAWSDRWPNWIGGLLLGLAALTRPTIWPLWLGLMIVDYRHWRRNLIITAVGLALCLPWTLRNSLVLGRAILTTTHGGYTVALGFNDQYYDSVVTGEDAVFTGQPFADWQQEVSAQCQADTEVARDRCYQQAAWSWIRHHPGPAAWTMLHHVISLWRPASLLGSDAMRLAIGSYYVLLYLAAVGGLVRGGLSWPVRRVLLAMLLALTALHVLCWSDVRMRAPAIPLLALLAAACFAPTATPTATEGQQE